MSKIGLALNLKQASLIQPKTIFNGELAIKKIGPSSQTEEF
jgi:hypothetical protein